MKKYMFPVVISLIIGVSMAYFIIRQYESMPALAVSSEAESVGAALSEGLLLQALMLRIIINAKSNAMNFDVLLFFMIFPPFLL